MTVFRTLLGLSLICVSTVLADTVRVTTLTTEGMAEPSLVDYSQPRFSWRLESDGRGTRQSAYQLRLITLGPDGIPPGAEILGARVESDQSQGVTLAGFVAARLTGYRWQVRVWDQAGKESAWSEPATFHTGLLTQPWPALWIGDGAVVGRDVAPGARYFRKVFDVAAAPVKARLCVSAFGVVEPWLNGGKVSEDLFSPGWPDYRRRAFYVAYDVTNRIKPGQNALGLILAEGWFSSTLMHGRQAGSQPLVSAFLELTDAAGKVTQVMTDQSWQWAEGPITAQGIYFGEYYDARREIPRWSAPEADVSKWNWQPAKLQGVPAHTSTARVSPPVRRIEEVKPVSRRKIAPGVFIYDLGQNMVGWVRLQLTAPAGTTVKMRFAEMLEAPDRLHTAALRKAHATALYTAKGEGVELWEPRFSFFGFRYVEVSGLAEMSDDTLAGIVVHSDLRRIGHFECSNPLLNKLYLNALWGQKGNFLEIPTDCPQRDERLGWTGDAQVFAHTANYNFSSGSFYRQWLMAVRDGYRDEPTGISGFPDVAPDTGIRNGAAGWGDAGIIVPYVTWLHTGDRRLLEESFASAHTWVDAQTRDFPDGVRRSRKSYGDWLAPIRPPATPTPYELIATAYYAHVTDLTARMARELGNQATAARYETLFAHIKSAFAQNFIDAAGKVASDTQTAYLLALGFNLMPEELKEKAVANLVRTFAEKNDHLATGFLGTPLITSVLSENGHADLAYKVLLQETFPGWLFSIKNGATTIWERWDSWTPEQGFHPEGMNSFNHYAYGSVVGWFYDTIAGLKPDPRVAGWKRFRVAPVPGGGLSFARASVETPYGVAASDWKLNEGKFEIAITVPANTQADVTLPAAGPEYIFEGPSPLVQMKEVSDVSTLDAHVHFTLQPGTYRFSVIPKSS